MGFRATVQDFQPKYVWHSSPENLVALRVGAEIIREHTEIEAVKEERSSKSKQTVAQEKSEAVQKVRLSLALMLTACIDLLSGIGTTGL
jgi:wobble nucleotide-excising tRNase